MELDLKGYPKFEVYYRLIYKLKEVFEQDFINFRDFLSRFFKFCRQVLFNYVFTWVITCIHPAVHQRKPTQLVNNAF
jgi:hypothetical protein